MLLLFQKNKTKVIQFIFCGQTDFIGKIICFLTRNALKLDLVTHQKLAETIFDMGANAGVRRAAKMLQYV